MRSFTNDLPDIEQAAIDCAQFMIKNPLWKNSAVSSYVRNIKTAFKSVCEWNEHMTGLLIHNFFGSDEAHYIQACRKMIKANKRAIINNTNKLHMFIVQFRPYNYGGFLMTPWATSRLFRKLIVQNLLSAEV